MLWNPLGFTPSSDRLDDRFDGHLAHSGGELHDGRADRSIGDAAHARATAVDRSHQNVALGLLDREEGALRRRLVDRVDHIDVRMRGQQVFHCGLAGFRVAHGEGGAGDLRIALGDAEALQEAVVASLRRLVREVIVEHRDMRGFRAHGRLGPLANEDARLQVVGLVSGVGRGHRGERSVRRHDDDARIARFLHDRHKRGRVGWIERDAFDAAVDHVLDRADLRRRVAGGVGFGGHDVEPMLPVPCRRRIFRACRRTDW